jgi:hypothetical protein
VHYLETIKSEDGKVKHVKREGKVPVPKAGEKSRFSQRKNGGAAAPQTSSAEVDFLDDAHWEQRIIKTGER